MKKAKTEVEPVILTYKLKHNRDFSKELAMARKIAEVAVKTRAKSSKAVNHIKLKSVIANQVLRKYSRWKCKKVGRVKLTIPSQKGIAIQVDQVAKTIYIPCVKLKLSYRFPNTFLKVNQVELDNKYAYVSCAFAEAKLKIVSNYIGVDRNTMGHIAVIANPATGKVVKLGKKGNYINNKYKNIRKKLQKKGATQQLKVIKKKESNIVRNLNHHISRKIVEYAKENNSGIKLEKLDGIRNNKNHRQSFNYSLNSWSFYQLQQMIEYKARIWGVEVAYVPPQYTSQRCSRCGEIGIRSGKKFKCRCGHVDHADANAAFNVAMASPYRHCGNGQSVVDRDATEGSTDTPQLGMQLSTRKVA
jgi:putative transposase